MFAATFGWLCVETEQINNYALKIETQPPSGGCVLKQYNILQLSLKEEAATFGWLCVETIDLC